MLKPIGNFRRLPRDIQLYAWSWFLIGFGYFGILSVLFNLYLMKLGLGVEAIGFLTASGLLAWGFGALPAAMIGKRIGNRRAMILGMAIVVAGMTLLVCGGLLPVGVRVAWFAIWLIVGWLGNSLNFVNGAPWVMEVTTADERGNAFTAQFLMESLGGAAGSITAGMLPAVITKVSQGEIDSTTAYWLALWLMPVAYLGAFALLLRTQPRAGSAVESQSNSRAAMPYATLIFLGIVTFLLISGEGLVRPFFSLYLDTKLTMTVSQIGVIFALAQVIPLLSTLAAPWLLARWGVGRAMIAVGLANAASLLFVALISTQVAAATGYIVFMAVVPVAAVVGVVFSQEIVEARWRTVASMAYTIGLAFGLATYAGLGGMLITRYGYSALFFAGAFLALLMVGLIWGYLRSVEESKPQESKPVTSV